MRYNEELIGQSPLLEMIVRAAETGYGDSLSHIVCYGSLVQGRSHEQSDIDFFFVPRSESGYAFSRQFIWNGIGYDLWPVSPERARRIALLEEGMQSLFMEGRILYAPDARGLADFEEIRDSIAKNLGNGELVKTRLGESLCRIRERYFDLSTGKPSWAGVMEIWEGLLFLLALKRGTYVKRGLKGMAEECSRLTPLPPDFTELYDRTLREKDYGRLMGLTGDAIRRTADFLSPGEEEEPDPFQLRGFYEEFKSAYNGFIRNCRRGDPAGALQGAAQIEGETENFLSPFGPEGFPLLHVPVKEGDFARAEELCLLHERNLRALLARFGIPIREYSGPLPELFG